MECTIGEESCLSFTGVVVFSNAFFPNKAAILLVRDDHTLLLGLLSRRRTGDLKRISQSGRDSWGERVLPTNFLLCATLMYQSVGKKNKKEERKMQISTILCRLKG